MTFISDTDLEILCAARTILNNLEEDATKASYSVAARHDVLDANPLGLGRIAQAADHAEHAIFDALNILCSYRGQKIADDVLHNRGTVAA